MPITYRYPRPAINVNCVVLGWDRKQSINVLLVQRRQSPFRNSWALLGASVSIAETSEQTARNALKEQTGFEDIYLEQLYTFDAVDRDPRERVISVVYFALVPEIQNLNRDENEVRRREWFPITSLPRLAFDHGAIIDFARAQLAQRALFQPIAFELLPYRFSLTQIQQLYESILGRSFDKRNFRKKLLTEELLTETSHVEEGAQHRPAKLYRFNRRKYLAKTKVGLGFDLS
jgi:8-oxo-dGTP diphosphatase